MVGNRALGQLAEAFTAEDAKSAEWTEQTTAYTLTGDVREGGHTTVLAPLDWSTGEGAAFFPQGGISAVDSDADKTPQYLVVKEPTRFRGLLGGIFDTTKPSAKFAR